MAQEKKQQQSIFVDEDNNGVIEKKRLPVVYLFITHFFIPELNIVATKVGYTTQKLVNRINQWRSKGGFYSNIIHYEAVPAYFDTSDGERVYVLDHAYHKMLSIKGFQKLNTVKRVVDHFIDEKISQEYYFNPKAPLQEITRNDLLEITDELRVMYEKDNAHADIKFYTDYKPSTPAITRHFEPIHDFEPREFQKEAILQISNYFKDRFRLRWDRETGDSVALDSYEKQFLLSAPTRSGKSFMSAMAVKEIVEDVQKNGKKNNVILIVSGIADVMIEWQRAFEQHIAFNQQKDGKGPTLFKFITRDELEEKGQSALDEAFANGAENVVIALTLQDLSGSFKKSKNEYFIAHDFLKTREDGSSPVDFLIVDEAHFAAFNRFGEYRKIISEQVKNPEIQASADEMLKKEEFDEAVNEFNSIDPPLGTLFVSATPYNEILGGDTFNAKNGNIKIISQMDIRTEIERWFLENMHLPEWKSPYYGIPNSHYFAIDPLDDIESILKADRKGRFVNNKAANSLIWSFCGYTFDKSSKYPKVLSDPEYVQAGLGNHVMLTVSTCDQADAIEHSLSELKNVHPDFEYEVLNLSSSKPSHWYRNRNADDISREITEHSNNGVKTITITVDRLGTGVTVQEWDTVVFLRSLKSAQRFDQIAGRPGTPYVVTMIDGDGETIQRAEKQNTAVISYSPHDMLKVVHETAVTMARVKQDTDKPMRPLNDLIDDELSMVPLYTFSTGSNYMVKATAANIIEKVNEAAKSLGPKDHAKEVIFSYANVFSQTELVNQILQIKPDTKKGGNLKLEINAMDIPDPVDGECHVTGCGKPSVENSKYGNVYCKEHLTDIMRKADTKVSEKPMPSDSNNSEDKDKGKDKKSIIDDLNDRMQSFTSVLFMFVALAPGDQYSVKDILNTIENPENKDARRIAKSLGINVDFLRGLYEAGVFNYTIDPKLHTMNNTLKNLNESSSIEDIRGSINILIEGFGKFSPNEVPTPREAVDKLVDKAGLTDDFWKEFSETASTKNDINYAVLFQKTMNDRFGNNTALEIQKAKDKIRFIDNGCKSAAIFIEIAHRASKYNIPLEMFEFYAIPTSSATYELIRKVYELMGWDLKNILFVEGIDPLTMNKMVELVIEVKDGCQRADDEPCVFHNWTGVTKRREEGIEHIEIPDKTADNAEWLEFSSAAIEAVFENIFDSIIDEEIQAAARDAWGKMRPVIERFDYAISNPPYQIQIGFRKTGQPHNKSVYGDFQKSALQIADNTAYIYPSGWQGSINTGFGKWLLENGLYSFNHYNSEDIFESIRKRYPIGIVTCKKGYNGDIYVNDMLHQRSSKVWYRDEIEKSIVEKTSKYNGLSMEAKHITDLRNIEESNLSILNGNSNHKDNPVNIYIKETAGPRADGKECYISYSEALEHFTPVDIDSYKCAVPWSHFVQSRSFLEIRDNFKDTFTIKVYPKNHVFAQTWMKISDFSTMQEAENFSHYLNAKIPTRLIAMYRSSQEFGLLVPDLGDYTNANPVFTPDVDLPENHEYKGLSLDQRLYKLFELTEEEIEIIEQ